MAGEVRGDSGSWVHGRTSRVTGMGAPGHLLKSKGCDLTSCRRTDLEGAGCWGTMSLALPRASRGLACAQPCHCPCSGSPGPGPHGPRPLQEDRLRPRGCGNRGHPRQDPLQAPLHVRGPQAEADPGGETQHPLHHQEVWAGLGWASAEQGSGKSGKQPCWVASLSGPLGGSGRGTVPNLSSCALPPKGDQRPCPHWPACAPPGWASRPFTPSHWAAPPAVLACPCPRAQVGGRTQLQPLGAPSCPSQSCRLPRESQSSCDPSYVGRDGRAALDTASSPLPLATSRRLSWRSCGPGVCSTCTSTWPGHATELGRAVVLLADPQCPAWPLASQCPVGAGGVSERWLPTVWSQGFRSEPGRLGAVSAGTSLPSVGEVVMREGRAPGHCAGWPGTCEKVPVSAGAEWGRGCPPELGRVQAEGWCAGHREQGEDRWGQL